jgi:hypothetical protein
MTFSRESIDRNIDEMMMKARQEGATNESLFLIDAPLREYIVAVEQMYHERDGEENRGDICESSVFMVCSMIVNLASITGIRTGENFVAFSNKFIYEVTAALAEVVNKVNGNPDEEYKVEQFDRNRTEH